MYSSFPGVEGGVLAAAKNTKDMSVDVSSMAMTNVEQSFPFLLMVFARFIAFPSFNYIKKYKNMYLKKKGMVGDNQYINKTSLERGQACFPEKNENIIVRN
jgi:hypothetical protein